MKKVTPVQVVSSGEAAEMPLPAEIQEALGELVGAAREQVSSALPLPKLAPTGSRPEGT